MDNISFKAMVVTEVADKQFVREIKEKHIDTTFDLYIFTSGKIQETLECQRFLNGYFKGIFSAEGLNSTIYPC